MILKILLTVLAVGVIIALICLVKKALLTPVYIGKNAGLEVCVRVSGPAPELENTVKGVHWLIESGALCAEVTILDEGMDGETRHTAEILNTRGLAKLKD